MDNNINDIDKFFKDRLDGFESPKVPGAWDNMAAMLDADSKGAAIAVKNINRFILASIAGAIVLAGSVIGYISGYDANSTATQNNTPNNTIVAEAPATNNKAENKSAATDNAAIINNSDAVTDAPAPEQTTTNSVAETPTVDNTPVADAPTTPVVSEKVPAVKDKAKPIVITKEQEEPVTNTTKKDVASISPIVKKNYSPTVLAAKNAELDNEFKGLGSVALNKLTAPAGLLLDSAQKAQRNLDRMKSFYKLQFGVQAGGNFNRVLSNTSTNFEVGSGLMAGVFLTKNISKKWGINAEFNYFRSTGNSISRTIKQTEIFLEKTTTSFFLVTKTFDFVQVPLSVSFAPTNKHRFNAGVSGSFMLNARTDVAENRERLNEETSSTVTKTGVYEDLNTFNYGLLLGYEYQLPGMYSIGFRYNQMLRDISNNSYFNDDKKHLPANLQLFIKLNLTK